MTLRLRLMIWKWYLNWHVGGGSDELFCVKITTDTCTIRPNATINSVDKSMEDYDKPLALDGETDRHFSMYNTTRESYQLYGSAWYLTRILGAGLNGVRPMWIDGKVYWHWLWNDDRLCLLWTLRCGRKDSQQMMIFQRLGMKWLRCAKQSLNQGWGDNISALTQFNNDFHQNYLLGLNYQLVRTLKEDGKTPNVSKLDAMEEGNADACWYVRDMISDWFSAILAINAQWQLGQGQSVMSTSKIITIYQDHGAIWFWRIWNSTFDGNHMHTLDITVSQYSV